MNAFTFLKLIRNIYGKGQADLAFIQRSGLLAVKIGQVHALRLDFLDEEKCRELSRLYRQNDQVPAEDIRALLASSAPKALLDSLETFTDQPLASASIGQVHRARLKDGSEVVIKLVKADVAEKFRKDVRSVKRLFKLFTWFYPKLRGVANPLGLIEQIERSTLSELDLRNEASGHMLLEEIWKKEGQKFDLSKLKFGKIYPEFSNERVLVSQYIAGRTADELIADKELKYGDLLQLFRVHGYFLFAVGVFHGDLHPGNVIVSGGDFYLVDTGYIGRVEKRISDNLLLFFRSLGVYDYRACARHLENMSEEKLNPEAYAAYESKFIELYKNYTGATVSQVSLTRQMMRTIRLAVLSGMRFSEGIFDIIKSLMYLDGMVLRVNPESKLVADMRPFTFEFKEKPHG